MNNISPHLSFEKIADMVLNEVTMPGEADHLNSCTVCSFEKTQLSQLVNLMTKDDSEDAPPFAVAALLRAFDEHRTHDPATGTKSIGQRLKAILRLDSSNLSPAYGFRSFSAANSRQLLFSTDEGSLDIRITPIDASWVISGQVLGQITGGTVNLNGEDVVLSGEIDSKGQFAFPPIGRGIYRLHLHSESFDVEVPDLEVG